MEAICSSKTSVDFHRTTRRYIPEDIVTFLVTVDGVLDWQLDLLDQLLQHVVTLYSSL
jgi:hypothetical protein